MKQERKPKRNDRWQCPVCKSCITLHVQVIEAPLCGNKETHSTKQVEMMRTKTTESRKKG
jgi:C4-type Zn-finger protein